MTGDLAAIDRTISTLAARLIDRRTPSGHWEGCLASSALSTATATVALIVDERASGRRHQQLTHAGLAWLIANQSADGGWGDTVVSASNLSTTVLCWAALSLEREHDSASRSAVHRAEQWLIEHIGDLRPENVSAAILAAYGKDRTFSAPILTVLALTGKLGAGPDAWRFVPQLPFELAACPHRWLEWLRLPVVSYALPALVAIGQARHHHRPTRNVVLASIRSAIRSRTRRVARDMQPQSGGYLEATPLTAFVVMSLIHSGNATDPIVEQGTRFLAASARSDGSWPIDTNLATWVTTLSVDALEISGALEAGTKERVLDWLLEQQVRHEHPFTRAKPGGWAWTDLTGGVPDADDTAGALKALSMLCGEDHAGRARLPSRCLDAAVAAIDWLLNLQNRDGGIPTFCRGWGALPFDRSAPDLTAHALHAWSRWYDAIDEQRRHRMIAASRRAVAYLARCQRDDGSWIPLWFGNEQLADHTNPTYGTARVVSALCAPMICGWRGVSRLRETGNRWLLQAQNTDGGWGAGASRSTIEETGVALQALATVQSPANTEAISRASQWLISATNEGHATPPSPIGLYFARLWYYEELYPLIFALLGLSASRAVLFQHRILDVCHR